MALAKMHDIAGCRLIFRNQNEMIDYINALCSSKQIKHKRTKIYNYIKEPHPDNSGYRGIHLEYQYKSRKASDRSDHWDGLLMEIQFRTIYQHAWATAVELADKITQNKIKFNQGDEDQKEFFRLASEIIARVFEGQYSCYPELSNSDLVTKFENIEQKINLLHRLNELKVSQKNGKWRNCVILHFESTPNQPNKFKLNCEMFQSFAKANKRYFELEKSNPKDDIVLVRTSDRVIGKSIRNAYKNYFSDAKDFVEYIDSGLKSLKGEKTITPIKITKKLNPSLE